MQSDEREVLVDAIVVNLVPMFLEDVEKVLEPLNFAGFVPQTPKNVGQFLTHLLLVDRLVGMEKH